MEGRVRQGRVWLSVLLVALAAGSVARAEGSPGPVGLFRIGGGIGIPYGILGLGIEVSPAPCLSLNAGFGLPGAVVATVGGRVFPLGRAHAVRPRLSVAAVWLEAPYDYGVVGGTFVAYGVGAEWGMDRHRSIDFDLHFMNVDGETTLVPTLGYGVHF
ncbi:MAG: hypothetical protein P1P84_00005 [Deferrisomatales bacterium]|nr:hypothetical protein [Deferrisomatales bacterium]